MIYPDCVRKLCPDVSELELKSVMSILDQYERSAVEEKGGVLFEDVLKGLQVLKAKYRLFLVSNCQEWYLRSFLNHSDTASLFEDWECYGRKLSQSLKI